MATLAIVGFGTGNRAPAQQGNDFIYKTTPLPSTRAFGGSAVLGDYYYYFGGSFADKTKRNKTTPTTSVVRARVLPDGKLNG